MLTLFLGTNPLTRHLIQPHFFIKGVKQQIFQVPLIPLRLLILQVLMILIVVDEVVDQVVAVAINKSF